MSFLHDKEWEGDRIRLTWKNEGVLSDERLGDELWCVVMMDDKNFRVVEPGKIGRVRGDRSAEVALTEEGVFVLFLWFCR